MVRRLRFSNSFTEKQNCFRLQPLIAPDLKNQPESPRQRKKYRKYTARPGRCGMSNSLMCRLQLSLQIHHVHQLNPALIDGVVVVVGKEVPDQMVPAKPA